MRRRRNEDGWVEGDELKEQSRGKLWEIVSSLEHSGTYRIYCIHVCNTS